jgi:PAS domain S-box-containing protein
MKLHLGSDQINRRCLTGFCELAVAICHAPIATLVQNNAGDRSIIAKVGVIKANESLVMAAADIAIKKKKIVVMGNGFTDAELPASLRQKKRGASSQQTIRFLAGLPAITPNGVVLGALCVADYVPRKLERSEIKALKTLANQWACQLPGRDGHCQSPDDPQGVSTRSEHLLACVPSILVGISEEGIVTTWNAAAAGAFGLPAARILGHPLDKCPIPWDLECVQLGIELCKFERSTLHIGEMRYTDTSGRDRFLAVSMNPIHQENDQSTGVLLTATDITDRKVLESQLSQAQKLESIGQLAAGVAHEINTPIQYVSDNTRFVAEAFTELKSLISLYERLADAASDTSAKELVSEIQATKDAADTEYLLSEAPKALDQSLEGLSRVAQIVLAMKEFSHPGGKEKTLADVNHLLENAITISRNRWRFVAEVVTNLDPGLPKIPCLPAELSQVFLNMIVNAADAIGEAFKHDTEKKGTITITTRLDKIAAEIWIADNVMGIPVEARSRIFDPFFTTKEMGQGSGLGLAIDRSAIQDKHGGSITFETEIGQGTTFIVRLPLHESETEGMIAA